MRISDEENGLSMEVNYGLIVIDPKVLVDKEMELLIYHFCGYEKEPLEKEIDSLREELNTDSEFGLAGKMNQYLIVPAPPEVVEYFTNPEGREDLEERLDEE